MLTQGCRLLAVGSRTFVVVLSVYNPMCQGGRLWTSTAMLQHWNEHWNAHGLCNLLK